MGILTLALLLATQAPTDARLALPKDLDGTFPMEAPASREAWERRAEELRRRVQVATGLWPMPERTPLNAQIWGKAERPDFTVEKVAFESTPGHFVAGLLFRPKGKSGKHPGVLSPHGHEGRLWDLGEAGVKKQVAAGQERFEKSGRFPQLARCANLARLGCVVFIPDMLGYADSVQISNAVAHKFAKQRPEMDTPERWGFFSPQAELRLQSILGVQAWNALRALDFLASLPDVDATRLGVTGSSGGGTQTILVCALDPRPVVAFPQGMVSTSMQGGCTCENACYLRIGTGNVELTALFAPKPQAMTAANDWTKEMMTKGFPELEKLYGLYDAKDRVSCVSHVQYPHNYNVVTRELMYAWFQKPLGLDGEPKEADFEPLTPAEFTVWDEAHPKPAGGEDVEAAFLKSTAAASERQISGLPAKERTALVAAAYEVMVGRGVPSAGTVFRDKLSKEDRGEYWRFEDLLRYSERGELVTIATLHPKGKPWNGKVVIWADGAGKAGLFAGGAPRPEVKALLDAGCSVMAPDLLLQGAGEQPKVKNPRESAAFTYGYNAPLFAQRVHDLLTVISFVLNEEHAPRELILVGANGAGPLAASARQRAGAVISRCVIDTQGFRFGKLKALRDPDFLPGAVKYGDLPGLLSLIASEPLLVVGEAAVPEGVKSFASLKLAVEQLVQ